MTIGSKLAIFSDKFLQRTNKVYRFDVVITAHNPVLALLLLNRSLSMGFNCLITSDTCCDNWPYDLACHKSTIDILATSFGLKPDRYGTPELFYSGFADEFIKPFSNRITVLERGKRVSIMANQSFSGVSFTIEDNDCNQPLNPDAEYISSVLNNALKNSTRLTKQNEKNTVIYGYRAFVTALHDGFAPSKILNNKIFWKDSGVYGVGTAHRLTSSYYELAEMMVEDFVRCSQYEF